MRRPQSEPRSKLKTSHRTSRITAFFALSTTVLVIIAALAFRFAAPDRVRAFADDVFDSYQRLSPRAWSPDLPVRIVDIDEASLGRLGQWPWPRNRLAELTNRLTAAGAAAIVFDFVFAEPDRTSPEEILKSLAEAPARDALRRAISESEPHDRRFADALEAAPSVLAVVLRQGEPTKAGTGDEESGDTGSGDEGGFPAKAGFATAGDDPWPFIPAFGQATEPLPVLAGAATGLGAINWLPDHDQVVRRVPLVFRLGDDSVPGLVAEALRVAQGASTYVLRASNASGETAFGARSGLNAIRVGALETATDTTGALVIRYTPHEPRRFIPAWRILSDGEPNQALRAGIAGRIVLVGTSAPGLFDLRATPISRAVPGVEIHAQAIEHILAGERLTRPDWASGLEIVAAVLGALLAASLVVLLPARIALPLSLFLAALGVYASWLTFSRAGLLVDPAFPTATGLAALFGATGVVTFAEQRARQRIRTAFGRYLAPELVDELADDPSRLVLGGENRELTVLFSDIRGFTTLAEGFQAEALTRFINGFLTPMTDVILSERGTIDKYMGDAIMAFWNAPMDDPAHGEHACRAALSMLDALAALNARREGPAIAIGIGLNTGQCCVGNLGSEQRFDYSAIGDDVNIASRLEDLTKVYRVAVIAGETTVAKAPGFAFLEIDRVRVKGRDRPLTVFALLGDEARHADPAFTALKERQAAMLAAYRRRDWVGARAALTDLAEVADLTGYAAMMAERIKHLAASPPPADWDGVFRHLTKG